MNSSQSTLVSNPVDAVFLVVCFFCIGFMVWVLTMWILESRRKRAREELHSKAWNHPSRVLGGAEFAPFSLTRSGGEMPDYHESQNCTAVKTIPKKDSQKVRPPAPVRTIPISQQQDQTTVTAKWRWVLMSTMLAGTSLWGQTEQAQATSPSGSNSPGQRASASDSANARILQELERMRRRIQELEAQLQQQSASPTVANSGSSLVEPQRILSASATVQSSNEKRPNVESKLAKAEPFAFADWSWLNGNARTKTPAFDSKFFTPEIRADVDYIYDFAHPKDDTISGSSEVFRSSEVQLTQLGVGGDFHFDNVRARLMTQFGMYSQTTPRNDASPSRGQWNLDNTYRYISEAYGGYHFNALHGINVDAGIFMSYVGLFSYYNFDNWAYQPSYVSSNTPWFFNGVRIQIFPTERLKIEPWFVNGWQAYGRFNNRPGVGGQILWRPNAS